MLLDTSGLLCLFDASEARHAQAVSFYDADGTGGQPAGVVGGSIPW
jgi:hypothetical protein